MHWPELHAFSVVQDYRQPLPNGNRRSSHVLRLILESHIQDRISFAIPYLCTAFRNQYDLRFAQNELHLYCVLCQVPGTRSCMQQHVSCSVECIPGHSERLYANNPIDRLYARHKARQGVLSQNGYAWIPRAMRDFSTLATSSFNSEATADDALKIVLETVFMECPVTCVCTQVSLYVAASSHTLTRNPSETMYPTP
jgi:hypothetical protein